MNKELIRSLNIWLKRGGLAIFDQIIYSGSNYFITLLLARNLLSNEYGAYSTVSSFLLLISTLHTALVVEPMMVFGSGRYTKVFYGYLERLILSQLKISLVISSVLFGAYYFIVLRSPEIGLGILGLSIAQPFIFFLWLMRRSVYVLLEPKISVYASILYSVIYIALVYLFLTEELLNNFNIFILFALASTLSAVFIFFSIRNKQNHLLRYDVDLRELNRLHFSYGKWALISSLLSWVSVDIHFLVLPWFGKLEDVATLRAIYNGILPVLSYNTAIAPLFIPAFVKSRKRNSLSQTILIAFSSLFLMAIFYYIFLQIGGINLLSMFYRGQYDLTYLKLLGLYPILAGVITTLASLIRSFEKPEIITRGALGAALFTLFIGLMLDVSYGYIGAIYSILGSSIVYIIILVFEGVKTKKNNQLLS